MIFATLHQKVRQPLEQTRVFGVKAGGQLVGGTDEFVTGHCKDLILDTLLALFTGGIGEPQRNDAIYGRTGKATVQSTVCHIIGQCQAQILCQLLLNLI